MAGRRAVEMDPAVLDGGAGADGDLGHRGRQAAVAAAGAGEGLDQGDPAVGAGGHEGARCRQALAAGRVQDLDRRLHGGIRRHADEGAVAHEGGAEGGEALVEVEGVGPQVVEPLPLLGPQLSEGAHLHPAGKVAGPGQVRGEAAVDEDEHRAVDAGGEEGAHLVGGQGAGLGHRGEEGVGQGRRVGVRPGLVPGGRQADVGDAGDRLPAAVVQPAGAGAVQGTLEALEGGDIGVDDGGRAAAGILCAHRLLSPPSRRPPRGSSRSPAPRAAGPGRRRRSGRCGRRGGRARSRARCS